MLISKDLCDQIALVIAETGLPLSINAVVETIVRDWVQMVNLPEDSRAVPPLILMIDQARKAKLAPRKFDSPKLP